MSFSLLKAGKIADVREQINAITFHDGIGQEVKELLLSTLDRQGDRVQFVVVEADGHSDNDYSYFNVKFRVGM